MNEISKPIEYIELSAVLGMGHKGNDKVTFRTTITCLLNIKLSETLGCRILSDIDHTKLTTTIP